MVKGWSIIPGRTKVALPKVPTTDTRAGTEKMRSRPGRTRVPSTVLTEGSEGFSITTVQEFLMASDNANKLLAPLSAFDLFESKLWPDRVETNSELT